MCVCLALGEGARSRETTTRAWPTTAGVRPPGHGPPGRVAASEGRRRRSAGCGSGRRGWGCRASRVRPLGAGLLGLAGTAAGLAVTGGAQAWPRRAVGRAQALLPGLVAASGLRVQLPCLAATGAQHRVEEERESARDQSGRRKKGQGPIRKIEKKRKKGREIWSFDSLVYHVKLFCQNYHKNCL